MYVFEVTMQCFNNILTSTKKKHIFKNRNYTKLRNIQQISKGKSDISLAKIYDVGTSFKSDIKLKKTVFTAVYFETGFKSLTDRNIENK